MCDPLILVHCRHTWSCSFGPPSMQEVSCGPSELCCQGHSTQQRSDRHNTHSGSKSNKTTFAARTLKSNCIKSTDDLMREFPDRFTGIGKFPGEYKICLCPDAHPVIHTPTKMSNCIMSQGQGAPGKNGSPGSNHPCRPAHRLGIINHLHIKGKWQTLPMSRSA